MTGSFDLVNLDPAFQDLKFGFIPDDLLFSARKQIRNSPTPKEFLKCLIKDGRFFSDCYFFAILARAFLLGHGKVESHYTVAKKLSDISFSKGSLIMLGTNWETNFGQFPDGFYSARQWLVCIEEGDHDNDPLFLGYVSLPEAGVHIGSLKSWEDRLLTGFSLAIEDPTKILTQLYQTINRSPSGRRFEMDLDSMSRRLRLGEKKYDKLNVTYHV